MALDKNDLKAIEQIVDSRVTKSETYLRDYVEFAIEKSEIKLSAKIDGVRNDLGGQISEMKGQISEVKDQISEVDRNIDDLIETNNQFIGYFNGHEKRIVRVEKKIGIKVV